MNEEPVYVWPDGTWCYKEDLEDMLTFMSDDYKVMSVSQALEEQFPEEHRQYEQSRRTKMFT